MTKSNPVVKSFLHRDLNVTPRRVRNFLEAPFEVQLLVRAELRRRANDDLTALELGLLGFALAFVALFVSPAKGFNLLGLPFLVALIAGAIIGVVGAVMLIPFAIGPLIRQSRRERAVVWLGAYDDAEKFVEHRSRRGRRFNR